MIFRSVGRFARIAGKQRDVPSKGEGGVVRPGTASGRNHFDDMSVTVVRPRIDGVDPVRRTFRIVGQHYINRAGDRVWFHIFWPVHRRSTEQIRRIPGFYQDIGLAVEAVCHR